MNPEGNSEIQNETLNPERSDEIEEITQLEYAKRLVRKYTMIGGGIGVIPLPVVDIAGALALQLKMIHELSELYQVDFMKNKATNIIGSLVGSVGVGLTVLPTFASALKFIPGVGTLTSSLVAMPVIISGSTYALGQVFIMHFETGGNILNFDADAMHDYFVEQYKIGKKLHKSEANEEKESAETTT